MGLATHSIFPPDFCKSLLSSSLKCGAPVALLLHASRIRGLAQGDFMQMAITFIAVVGGLIFSIAVALLAEELIFGQVFRLFFARPAMPAKSPQKN
jgi:hypothetical protein